MAIAGGDLAGEERSDLALRHCHLRGASLTGATWRQVELTEVVFEDCELSGTTWEEARLERVRFERCRMSGFTAPELRATDLAVVMPRNIARGFGEGAGFAIVEPDFPLRDFGVSLHWSRRFEDDAANRWLRQTIVALFGEV